MQLYSTFELKTIAFAFQFPNYISFLRNFVTKHQRKNLAVKETSDGSLTIFSERFGQTYHSIHGARTESERIFIDLGLMYLAEGVSALSILEVGFGTGLNAFLTQIKAEELQLKINYTGIEAYPVRDEDTEKLPAELRQLQTLTWNQKHTISPFFTVLKQQSLLEEYETNTLFHVIYFDAFSPEAQPELWTAEVFKKMFNLLHTGGVLTTYCSKSLVQKNLNSAGFFVEKHKGPPHKREVIRALKK